MTSRSSTVDSTWQPLYRAGGISAAIATLCYLSGMVLVVSGSMAPANATGVEMHTYVDGHRELYYLKQILWSLPSPIMIILSLALAIVGFRLGRSLALIAGTVAVASWAGSFAWSTTGEGSLAMPLLADGYMSAATDAERMPFIAGAETLIAINDMAAPLGALQTVGILLLGMLMLRGVFSKGLAWFTVATGLIGIVSEVFRSQSGFAYIVYGTALFIWLIWVALALWRIGRTGRGQDGDLSPHLPHPLPDSKRFR